MRLTEPTRVHRSIGAAAALLLVSALPAQAQYSGGIADGYSSSGLPHLTLDGTTLARAAFTGGTGGDGYSAAGLRHTMLDGNVLPSSVYTAGNAAGDGYSNSGLPHFTLGGASIPAAPYTATLSGGDGYDSSGLPVRMLNSSSPPLAVFKGGSGDGYDKRGIENRQIDSAAVVLALYRGGSGDGYDAVGVRHIPVSGQSVPAALFTASSSGGDGYDTDGTRFVQLDGASTPAALFTASNTGGDGYDFSRVAYISLDGAGLSEVAFLGNSGDGYSSRGFLHVLLDPAMLPPAALFAGGSGDGYDSRLLPFVQYMGGGGAASGVTFAGWSNSRFSDSEALDGMAEPGVDADGDGMANLLEFALGSDPRVADATLFGPDFRLSNLADLGLPALPDKYLTAIVHRNPFALDTTLRVEVSSDAAAFWSVNETVQVESSSSIVIVRDELGAKTAPRRLIRLRATLNP